MLASIQPSSAFSQHTSTARASNSNNNNTSDDDDVDFAAIMSQLPAASVTIPIFQSASSAAAAAASAASAAQSSNNQNDGWASLDQSSDPMDFDLLAEYLLEDNPEGGGASGGISFDFWCVVGPSWLAMRQFLCRLFFS